MVLRQKTREGKIPMQLSFLHLCMHHCVLEGRVSIVVGMVQGEGYYYSAHDTRCHSTYTMIFPH